MQSPRLCSTPNPISSSRNFARLRSSHSSDGSFPSSSARRTAHRAAWAVRRDRFRPGSALGPHRGIERYADIQRELSKRDRPFRDGQTSPRTRNSEGGDAPDRDGAGEPAPGFFSLPTTRIEPIPVARTELPPGRPARPDSYVRDNQQEIIIGPSQMFSSLSQSPATAGFRKPSGRHPCRPRLVWGTDRSRKSAAPP